MRFLNHYKTSIHDDSNIVNKIFYILGLTIANIIFFPFHKYPNSRNFVFKLIDIAERIPLSFLKAFFIGIVNHHVSDYFSYDTLIQNIIEKGEYRQEFSRKLDEHKHLNASNEVTKAIENYFTVEDIAGSIDKLYSVYEHLDEANLEIQKRALFDYLFISGICNKIYSSIVFF